MVAVIYGADGQIVQSVQGAEEMAQITAKAMNLAYLEVPASMMEEFQMDSFATTHKVQNDQLVAI